MKKWQTLSKFKIDDIVDILLKNRGLKTKKDIADFLTPPDAFALPAADVDIDKRSLTNALKRIQRAIVSKESVVVYADYDADGISAGAIMWETLYGLGARVMPYIPHRVEEGYGLSIKGLDAVAAQYDPSLVITVDHGITAKEKVAYAKKLGIDVIVTDHHVKPKQLPDCTIVHTTKLSGAGVSWFVAKELLQGQALKEKGLTLATSELLALAAIGTIADMVPLVGPNRSIVKHGLAAINKTHRVGLEALIADAGLEKGTVGTHEVSHMLAPRLNAMGRIEHALDALRLLCTKQKEKAVLLAQKLGLTNRERQQLTQETLAHASDLLKGEALRKLLFVVHESYNQGVIGLVAGKLVEEFYRPAIVVAKGEVYSKASARSINGFNIVEAIRSCSDILVDVGGHPMAAGFTVETKYLGELEKRLEELANKELTEEKLTRMLRVDAEVPLERVTPQLWQQLTRLEPYGFGNPEPVFVSRAVKVVDMRLVGADGKHLKLRIMNSESGIMVDAIGFGLGEFYDKLKSETLIDIAYTIDMNEWNGNKSLQLKLKDIHFSS